MKIAFRVFLVAFYAAMAAWVAYQFTPNKVKARKDSSNETLKSRMRAAYEVEKEMVAERELKMWLDPITGIESISEEEHQQALQATEAFMEGVDWGQA
jgi:hypothetical protein